MARLIYGALASLDGYVADEQGDFSWAEPSEEVHGAVNDLSRGVVTMLLGRRMYQVLAAWETMDTQGEPPVIGDFATIWRSTDKVVFSGSMTSVASERTRIERAFDPAGVRALLDGSPGDVSIGGPTLAAAALRAGLVDEIQLFLVPVIVGGGLRALPDGYGTGVELLDERRFDDGTVLLRYAPVVGTDAR
jgi:dihydrofolate reductase